MATSPQTTVEPAATTSGLGSSDRELMVELYPASPIHNGTMTRSSVREKADELLLQGVVQDGFGLSTFDRDFTGLESGVAPPDRDVETGGGGLPASPWVPNPASPGPGSQNPTDLPAAPDGFGTEPNGDTYGVGAGALTNPKDTSQVIARAKLGDFMLGTSTPR